MSQFRKSSLNQIAKRMEVKVLITPLDLSKLKKHGGKTADIPSRVKDGRRVKGQLEQLQGKQLFVRLDNQQLTKYLNQLGNGAQTTIIEKVDEKVPNPPETFPEPWNQLTIVTSQNEDERSSTPDSIPSTTGSIEYVPISQLDSQDLISGQDNSADDIQRTDDSAKINSVFSEPNDSEDSGVGVSPELPSYPQFSFGSFRPGSPSDVIPIDIDGGFDFKTLGCSSSGQSNISGFTGGGQVDHATVSKAEPHSVAEDAIIDDIIKSFEVTSRPLENNAVQQLAQDRSFSGDVDHLFKDDLFPTFLGSQATDWINEYLISAFHVDTTDLQDDADDWLNNLDLMN